MAPEKAGTQAASRSTISTLDSRSNRDLKALRYEDVPPAKPPIPVTVPPPRAPPNDIHPALRSSAISLGEQELMKRDSGLAPTTSTIARGGSTNPGDSGGLGGIASGSINSLTEAAHALSVAESDSSSNISKWKKENLAKEERTPESEVLMTTSTSAEEFSPIMTQIPTDAQLELDFINHITFSNRGSVLLGGRKAVKGQARLQGGRRQPNFLTSNLPNNDTLSEESEMESQKVRSMYETDTSMDWKNGRFAAASNCQSMAGQPAIGSSELLGVSYDDSDVIMRPSSAPEQMRASDPVPKRDHELAGGIEDWEDVSGGDVDRYGFIITRKELSNRSGTPEPRPPQRMSTALLLASESPRPRRGFGRTLSSAKSSQSVGRKAPSHKFSGRSLKTVATGQSQRSSRNTNSLRSARNRLPGNQDRRWMDEAGDMLTLPPGLADIAEHEEGGKAAEVVKRKEWDRAEKWTKMAKIVKKGPDGEGMVFEFDSKHPKLIERTWKGIPDRWRASAWYSFLASSAQKMTDSPTEEQIVEDFHKYLHQSSRDDVQIDMDVPRTINSHIMFRRRYRGGQRLLFRVLHSLSLYYPVTGYVQGMASLAATLLCYYDEEKCFVMLVRMWKLRGLDKLYAPGFGGLMAALDEFQKQWMNGHEVSNKLDELNVEPTAYGTRWYLTLFNYSIPFAAQLRVWDVFMLLGDADLLAIPNEERPFGGGINVLHAASAALIDGTREILLDSDFENAMKVLTSWIPIKDEELFMKVAKAEWKIHHKKSRSQGS